MHRYHPRHAKRRRSFRRLYATVVGVAMVALAVVLPAQTASADYYGSRFADGRKPICVSTGWIDNSRVRAAVKAAVSDWNTSTKLDVRTRTNCKASGYKQRVWVLDANYGTNWSARAAVTNSWWGKSPTPYRWTANGYTYLHDQVTLKFDLSTIKRWGFSDARLQSTAAHEIGHALGLDHRGGESVMVEQGWTRTVQYWDRLGTWDHPGVNRIYDKG